MTVAAVVTDDMRDVGEVAIRVILYEPGWRLSPAENVKVAFLLFV